MRVELGASLFYNHPTRAPGVSKTRLYGVCKVFMAFLDLTKQNNRNGIVWHTFFSSVCLLLASLFSWGLASRNLREKKWKKIEKIALSQALCSCEGHSVCITRYIANTVSSKLKRTPRLLRDRLLNTLAADQLRGGEVGILPSKNWSYSHARTKKYGVPR